MTADEARDVQHYLDQFQLGISGACVRPLLAAATR